MESGGRVTKFADTLMEKFLNNTKHVNVDAMKKDLVKFLTKKWSLFEEEGGCSLRLRLKLLEKLMVNLEDDPSYHQLNALLRKEFVERKCDGGGEENYSSWLVECGKCKMKVCGWSDCEQNGGYAKIGEKLVFLCKKCEEASGFS